MSKLKLHDYQKRTVEFLKKEKSAILSISMGLGKTISTLYYINEIKPKTVLIIAPKRVAEHVWKQEAKKWGLDDVYRKMVIVCGTPSQRKEKLENDAKPYKIIGRDNLSDLKNWSCEILVLDELTSFKSITAKRSKAVHAIKRKQTIGLTGTFLANGAIDIYGQAKAVGLYNGAGQNFYAWRATYFKNVMQGSRQAWEKWVLRVPLDEVLKPIQKNIFTLTSEDYLDIPEVEYIKHDIELKKDEFKEYMRLSTMLQINLDGVIHSVKEQAKFAKLQTACLGFIYDTKTGDAFRGKHCTKIDAVVELVERAVSEGESVLLAYGFKEEAIWIGEKLKKKGITFCSPNDKKFLEKFESKEVMVLIGHPSSIGHGINLQNAARICVWSSITYNYELWAQMNARLARQGQLKAVKIHVFSSKDTIEQNQFESVMKKDKEQNNFLEITK